MRSSRRYRGDLPALYPRQPFLITFHVLCAPYLFQYTERKASLPILGHDDFAPPHRFLLRWPLMLSISIFCYNRRACIHGSHPPPLSSHQFRWFSPQLTEVPADCTSIINQPSLIHPRGIRYSHLDSRHINSLLNSAEICQITTLMSVPGLF